MIGTIEIRVNSANPQMPLKTLATFQGSPSTIRLLEVPKAIGEWNITDVKILVKYPDNTQVAKGCVRVGNIWQGTISAPEMSGKVQNGFEVIADGEDEDGNPVENYILGVGDVEVLSRDAQALKDVEKVYVKFSDELPLNASKGDFVYHNGQYYIFNGTTWDAIPTGGGIPTKVSELENDVGYITANDLPEIPTKVSELENDVPYATNGQILDIEDEIDTIQRDLGETIGRVDALRGEVDGLHEIVPQQASTDNQLADKDFVNSSIATNTANFRGTYESEDDFPLSGNTPNDYVFLQTSDSQGNTLFKRFKWNEGESGFEWAYEYELNNSSFTSNQWATINSGLTENSLDDYAKKDEIDNTKIYSKSSAKDTPTNGDRMVAGDSSLYQYSDEQVWRGTPDPADPLRDERNFEFIEEYTGVEMGWVYTLKVDGQTAESKSYDDRQTEVRLEYFIDGVFYTYTGRRGDAGWLKVGEISDKAYVEAEIQSQPTLTFSGEYEDETEFSFEVVTK